MTTSELIPKQSITPHLIVKGAESAIDFYRRAFEAEELYRLVDVDGRISHAEIRIGEGVLMLADEYPETAISGPKTLGGSTVSLRMYVDDVDAFVARAVGAGATLQRPIEDQFYGDRSGTLEDPFGHVWHVATRKEEVSPEEMQRRMSSMKTC